MTLSDGKRRTRGLAIIQTSVPDRVCLNDIGFNARFYASYRAGPLRKKVNGLWTLRLSRLLKGHSAKYRDIGARSPKKGVKQNSGKRKTFSGLLTKKNARRNKPSRYKNTCRLARNVRSQSATATRRPVHQKQLNTRTSSLQVKCVLRGDNS